MQYISPLNINRLIDKRDNVNTHKIISATATTKNYQLIQFLFKCK